MIISQLNDYFEKSEDPILTDNKIENMAIFIAIYILIKVTQDQRLSTRFLGEKTPWIDVRNDAYYYNAARTVTSRGILEVRNSIRGEFGPEDPVHGADVLLSLRLLRDELKSYVRNS